MLAGRSRLLSPRCDSPGPFDLEDEVTDELSDEDELSDTADEDNEDRNTFRKVKKPVRDEALSTNADGNLSEEKIPAIEKGAEDFAVEPHQQRSTLLSKR